MVKKTTTKKPQPWEKQEDETDKNYYYFEIYRDFPTPIRSIDKVRDTLREQNKTITSEYLRQVSSANKWQSRVKAHDRHMSLVKADERSAAIREMENRHAEISQDMVDKIMDTVERAKLDDMADNKKAYFFDAITRALGRMIQMERLSLGESTSHIKKTQKGIESLMTVFNMSKKEYLRTVERKHPQNIDDKVIDAEFKEIKDE